MVDTVDLWHKLTSAENLWVAYLKARKGKSRRADVAKFSMQVEIELSDLRRDLLAGTYRPAGYRQYWVHDRKPRLISSAPFKDRVLHHALIQVVELLFEARFSDCSWACRQGKGTHQAVHTYQRWARHYAYALKMDVAGYFHSIDHTRLLQKIKSIIDDQKVIQLFQSIIESQGAAASKGLPIGNLTSQMLGNLYLNDLDHFITETLGLRAYLRYVDDMVVLTNSKAELWMALREIECRLAEDGLRLHPRKVYVTPTCCGLDLLGYRVYPRFIKLRHDNGFHFRRRFKQKLAAFRQGRIDRTRLIASVQSWIGHAKQADSYGLRKTLLSEIVLTRGMTEQAVDSRRFVVLRAAVPPFRPPGQEQAR